MAKKAATTETEVEAKVAGLMSAKMKEKSDALYKPFPDRKVKERPGKKGQSFHYIESAEILHRLNQVFGYAWSIRVIKYEFIGSPQPFYVTMLIELEVPDPDNPELTYIKTGWSGHPLLDRSGKLQDLGDALKSVESKAISKAAAKLGISLYLWGVGGDDLPCQAEQDYTGEYDSPPWEGGVPLNQPAMNPFPPPPPQAEVFSPTMSPPPVVNPAPVTMPPPIPVPPSGPAASGPPSSFPHMGNPGAYQGPPVFNGPLFPPPPASNVGFTSGPGTSATTQVGINVMPAPPTSSGPPTSPGYNDPSGRLAEFQAAVIQGAANLRHVDPMQLVMAALGQSGSGITALDQLTFDQAAMVLDYIRETGSLGA